MTLTRRFHDIFNQQDTQLMLFRSNLQAKPTVFSNLLTASGQFLKDRKTTINHWLLTLSILNTESQWQQVLSSWKDIQTGHIVSATEAFANIDLLEETEGIFNG